MLRMSEEPDGMGYFYGHFHAKDRVIRVDIKPTSFGVYQAYIEGEEFKVYKSRGAAMLDLTRELDHRFESRARIPIDYTNHRGERSIRFIIPTRIYFGKNEYHPEEQWIIEAYDVLRRANRTFAVNNIHNWGKVHGDLSAIT